MSEEALNEFFAAVNKGCSDVAIENEMAQLARLENSIVRAALRAGGAVGNLKALARDCQAECQLSDEVFTIDWFAHRYPNFPATLLATTAYWSNETRLVDFLQNPKSSSQFRGYVKSLEARGVDDAVTPVCCIFRAGNRPQCIHNMASSVDEIFKNVTPAANTNAVLLRVSFGVLCMQPYAHFLKSLGTKWCENG